MADANKQKPSWTFGQSSADKSGGGLFGQGGSTSKAPSGGGLFGSNSAPTASSGTGLFGSGSNPPATSGTSLFGSTPATSQTQSSSLFGASGGGGGGNSNVFGGGSKPASSPFDTSKNASGGLFGSSQATLKNGQPAISSAPSQGFSAFSTPSKPSDSTPSEQQKPNLFGGASTGSSFFPNLGANASAGQASTTTPTSKPTTSLFGTSTTPAGPPPGTTTGAGSAFNFLKPQSQAEVSSGTTTPSLFGQNSPSSQNLFGLSKPPGTSSTATATQPASVFDSTSKDLFGNKRAAQPEGGMFKNLNQNKSQDTGNSKPNPFSAPTSVGQTSGAPALGGPAANPKIGFPSDAGSLASLTGGSNPMTASSIFTTSKPTTSTETSAPSTSTPTSSLFPSLGVPENVTKSSAPPPSSSSAVAAAAAPASTSTPSLFNTSKPTASAGLSQASTQDASKAPAAPAVTGAANANLGASVTGPAPPPQSRLKNKSMDDIINRWASDLSKYQKEFQTQAGKVAQWDRMLVENSEKIQRLYGSTLEAERATSEVERQLTAVENDQAELELWLDHYEKEVDSMISNQVGQGESISGPDQERERTYQLAARLSEKLDEMGKDLGTMIEEINDASSNLSNNGKADDPLSQVVRVLNNHLTQLQQIDQGAAALTLKVKEAQKAGQVTGPPNGLSGPSSDAADGFYRSFMGRR